MGLNPFQQEMDAMSRHYAELLAHFGDSPQAVQYSDRKTQERRLEILAQVGDLRTAKVLDFGCGVAHLYDYLRKTREFQGEYVGYDYSEAMVAAAKAKFPEARVERRDVLVDGVPEDFDFVLISGVFNIRISDNWGWTTSVLRQLFPRVRTALALNLLSVYVDYQDEGLWYADPEQVFGFCKEELSPCVTLRHDYLVKPGVVPFEFSVYVYSSPMAPRKKPAAGRVG